MSKLHPFSAVVGTCALLRRRGGKSCFLEKNRPSRRYAFVRKSQRRRQNSAELVDVRERKGKDRGGRRSDPEKTFSRVRSPRNNKKADSATATAVAAKLGPCLVREIIVISYFPLPRLQKTAVRSSGQRHKRHKPNWLLPPMWDRDCPSPPLSLSSLRASLIPADNSL